MGEVRAVGKGRLKGSEGWRERDGCLADWEGKLTVGGREGWDVGRKLEVVGERSRGGQGSSSLII
jgi:hypothetical protein